MVKKEKKKIYIYIYIYIYIVIRCRDFNQYVRVIHNEKERKTTKSPENVLMLFGLLSHILSCLCGNLKAFSLDRLLV